VHQVSLTTIRATNAKERIMITTYRTASGHPAFTQSQQPRHRKNRLGRSATVASIKRGGLAGVRVLGRFFAPIMVCVLTALYVGSGAGAATPSTTSQASDITNTVRDVAKQDSLHSVIFGVWRHGEAVATGALGTAYPGVPATVDDHFRIGNVTEAMEATLLLQLVQQGKISLDDKLSKWYPSLPRANEITVRMLASSTSGYVHYVNVPSFVDAYHANVFATWTPNQLIQIGTSQPMLFAPGTSWSFSDTNFVLLGEILRKVGGEPVGEQIQQRILEPLGMRHTEMTTTAETPSPVLHSYTGERGVWEDATFWNPSWATHTGNMTSNLSDLEKWGTALGTGSLISKSSHAQQIAPKTVGLGPLNKQFFYGLGVGVSNGWVFSAPGLEGYTGVVAYLPKTQTTLVVFTTSTPDSPSGTHYAGAIFKAVAKIVAPSSLPTFPGA
jgi:D-alanyl-D-alanine carboxypeptidase